MRNTNLMLATLITITSLLFLGACASPGKMVAKGEYEKLWSMSINKTAKGKRLPVDWLQGMETSFRELQKQDSLRVVMLFKRNNKTAWNDILDVVDRVEYRQDQLQRFIPVYDKNGRRGRFNFMDVRPWREKASKNLTADFMQDALRELNVAESTGNKKSAIKAARALEGAREHNPNIPQWNQHYNKAVNLATVSVNLEVSEGRGYFPDQMVFERKLREALTSMQIPFLDLDFKSNKKSDYRILIEPRDIVVSPPEELVHRKDYEKEITGDSKKIKVWNEQDSIWEEKTQKAKEKVSAELVTITQLKRAMGQVRFVVYSDYSSKSLGDRIIDAQADFRYNYYRVNGDERALDSKVYEKEPVMYPNDFEMVAGVHDAVISEILNHIQQWDWW